MADKTTLLADLRAQLGNPDTTELSVAVLTTCLERSLDEYSRFHPIEYFYYNTSTFKLVADTIEYSLPAETIGVAACRIYTTEIEIKDNRKYFKSYQETAPYSTGYGDFNWAFASNKLELTDYPAAADAGKLIACLLYKAHVFNVDAITTIDRATLEGSILDYAMGEALETWAGYAGSISFGSGREDREPVRRKGEDMKKKARMDWGTAII